MVEVLADISREQTFLLSALLDGVCFAREQTTPPHAPSPSVFYEVIVSELQSRSGSRVRSRSRWGPHVTVAVVLASSSVGGGRKIWSAEDEQRDYELIYTGLKMKGGHLKLVGLTFPRQEINMHFYHSQGVQLYSGVVRFSVVNQSESECRTHGAAASSHAGRFQSPRSPSQVSPNDLRVNSGFLTACRHHSHI